MAIAIRTITRVQDADDLNVSLGAGVDEYVLCWDNDTAKFVLREMTSGVTDHGALTGLDDDDHAQYVLSVGRATGQTIHGSTAENGDITIEPTSHAVKTSAYVLLAPSGGWVGIGQSTPAAPLDVLGGTLGSIAGNTLNLANFAGSTSANIVKLRCRLYRTSNDSGWGTGVIQIGRETDTSWQGYISIGGNTVGINTTLFTTQASFEVLGHTVLHVGSFVDPIAGTGASVKISAVAPIINNPPLAVFTAGMTGMQAVDKNTYGAYFTNTSTVSGTGINYGFYVVGANNYFSGNVGVGVQLPNTKLHVALNDAATNAITNIVTIGHNSTGTAAAGFGAGQLFTLESSTTNDQSAALISVLWYEATHASRKADLVLSAYDTAAREGIRIRGGGSEPYLGFYGVTPIARAVLATGAGAAVDDVITALQNLGLVKQS